MKHMLELYLTDVRYKFVKGFYHCGDQKLKLAARTYFVPDILDAMIVGVEEEVHMWGMKGSMCQYYLDDTAIEFFRNPTGEDEAHLVPMLIHNVSPRPLSILFENCDAEYIIAPGESKEIVPFQNK
ncbi:MAG: hypothetical protein ACLRSB_05905 [Blautia hansenii]